MAQSRKHLGRFVPEGPAPRRYPNAPLGYQLLEADRVDDAVEIFVLNAEEYPWSANVYDSLVDAYLRAGRSELALQNARRAFLIDKQYTRILEMEARDPADH